MITEDELFDLSKKFDRENQKVLTVLPERIQMEEVVGCTHYPGKYSKVTIRRGEMLLLCVVPSSYMVQYLLDWKEKIKKRSDPLERYEAWEIYGADEAYSKVVQLLGSRMSKSERKRFDL